MSKQHVPRLKALSYLLIYLTAVYPLHPAIAAANEQPPSPQPGETTVVNHQLFSPHYKDGKVPNKYIPVVNMAAPNEAGVIHLRFGDFNVYGGNDLVLNNALSETQTTLAKQIWANPNFNGKAADLIIGEVKGPNHSELTGAVEVAGQKANLIIANPNGITCNGCSFINAPAVTLTTGRPVLDNNGALAALIVQKGTVTIGEQGLSGVEGVGWGGKGSPDYIDIISRATILNGKVHAKNLTLTQGANWIDFKQGTIVPIAGEGEIPPLAVDTRSVGGMYANKIRLVGTEAGVGVNLTNLTTTQGDIRLTVDGKVTLGKVNAETDINVSSRDIDIDTKGSGKVALEAKKDITLATNRLFNTAYNIAYGDMRLFVDRLDNQKGVFESYNSLWLQKDAAGNPTTWVDNTLSSRLVTKHGDMVIRTKNLSNTSDILSGANAYINATKLDDKNGWLRTGKNLILAGHDFNGVGSVIQSGLNVTADFKNTFELLRGQSGRPGISAHNILLRAGKIGAKDHFGLKAKNDLSMIADGVLDVYAGRVEAGKNLTFIAGENASIARVTLKGQDVELIARTGDIKMKGYNGKGAFPDIAADNNLRVLANRHIGVSDTHLKGGNIEFLAPKGDITIEHGGMSVLAANDLRMVADGMIGGRNRDGGHYLKLKGENVELLARQGSIQIFGADNDISAGNNLRMFAGDSLDASGLRFVKANNITLNAGSVFLGSYAKWEANKDLTFIAGEKIHADKAGLKGENVELVVRKGDIRTDMFWPSISADKNVRNVRISAGKNLYFYKTEFDSSYNLTLSAGHDLDASGIRNSLRTAGSINLFAGNDIKLFSAEINAGQQITLSAGRNIDMYDPKMMASRTGITAGDQLQLRAGGDIVGKYARLTSTAGSVSVNAGRNVVFLAQEYLSDDYSDSKKSNTYGTSALNAAQNLTLSAAGDLSTYGASLISGRDMTLSAGGNVRFESLQEYIEEGNRERFTPRASQLKSGGALTLHAQGSILFQATSLIAKGGMDIAAKGGLLYAQAMEETYKWDETSKVCKTVLGIKSCLFGSKTETRRKENSTNKVTEFVAGGDINLMAKDDVTLEASRIETHQNAKITSQTGKVTFKAMPNTAFEQTVSTSTGFYITHRDKGYDEKTWVIPSVQIGGTLTVDAAKGIHADVKAKEGQRLEDALAKLGSTPGTEWLKDLQNRNDVQWHVVKDAYSSWDKKNQSLNPVVGAVIAIAVAAVTAGSGLAAMAGKGAVGATGATGAVGSAVYGAAYGGMIGLASQAAVALVENKGNLTKTLDALAKRDSVKSLVTQMVVGGALAGLDHSMGWGKLVEAEGVVNPIQSQLPLLNNDWGQVTQRIAAQSVVSSTLGTAINGGSFTDNLRAVLLSNIGNQVHAKGASLIGENGKILGHPGKILSHAVVAGISAEIAGGDAKGAAVGSLAAELAAISLGDNMIKAEEWGRVAETQARISRVLGGFTGAVFTGEAGGVYSGATAAETTFRYNYLAHHQKELRDKELAAESNSLKRGLIHIKWGLTSTHQDGVALAGFVSGVPAELYDTVLGIVGAAVNYKETLQALRNLINSDSMLNTVYQAEKADIVKRLDTIQRDYDRAGIGGAYNAGLETGKLTTKVIGYLAVVKGSAGATTNTFKSLSKFSGLKNAEGMVNIKNVYRLEKDGSKTPMAWKEGNYKQGYPFEDFVGKELKLPESSRLPYGTEVFDYYTKSTGQAISVKTLDTATNARIQNPKQISSQLNSYINDIDGFSGSLKGKDVLTPDMIKQKTLHLAVPEKTTPSQWAEINQSISYAAEKKIDVKVTVVRGETP
ncbi:DUF637 domain-containing protein [Xenorhabdus lircayensis]|uniref:DUF637 domain-containing protein n=1 Tax=Xenorhabdus lircayensis TaxID=2763499 RepID=A0ABS0U4V6_9GAMM|nr:DUF637 domain-containing protein [Xenorhabdus lircayensis]MBI6548647.1 DUF637 domain-containing protein [Xenorhabdus lircayensis]